MEGVRLPPRASAEVEICHRDGTVAVINLELRRLMRQSAPTALVANADHDLTLGRSPRPNGAANS